MWIVDTQHLYTGASIWWVRGRDPQILGMGGRWELQGFRGGRGRVVKYYYILSCTGSMFDSGDF